MIKLISVFSIILLFEGCKPEQQATEFGITAIPDSGKNQELTINQDTPKNISYSIDQKQGLEEAKLVISKGPENGKLSGCIQNSNNQMKCVYTPSPGFVGVDFIHFKMEFGDFDAIEGSYVKINVKSTAVDNESSSTLPPIIGEDQQVNVKAGEVTTIEFSQSTDGDSRVEDLTYQLVDTPLHGSLENCYLNLNNIFSCDYTPNPGFLGQDIFSYKVIDENGQESDKASVKVTVVQNCFNYKRLSIFLDKNSNEAIDENEVLGEISSYVGDLSMQDNYGYRSYSAHPIYGPEPSEYYGNVFLYEGPDGLSLNMFFNKDEGGNTDVWNDVAWDVTVFNNEKQDSVILSDDGHEVKKVNESNPEQVITNAILMNNISPNTSELLYNTSWQSYFADWSYKANTDGAVIGPLVGESFLVKIKMLDKGSIRDINFHSAKSEDDVFLLSEQNSSEATVFFVKYHTTEVCENY